MSNRRTINLILQSVEVHEGGRGLTFYKNGNICSVARPAWQIRPSLETATRRCRTQCTTAEQKDNFPLCCQDTTRSPLDCNRHIPERGGNAHEIDYMLEIKGEIRSTSASSSTQIKRLESGWQQAIMSLCAQISHLTRITPCAQARESIDVIKLKRCPVDVRH